MTFIGLFALDINEEFKYPKYFSMLPVGPDPRRAISEGFFDIVKQYKDKLGLKTMALAVGDGEATLNGADGARKNAKAAGIDLVYDKTYPLNTADFSPIIRAIQATNPDIVYLSSYPNDSVGFIRSVHEMGLNTKIFGGSPTGPQSTSIKMSLGSMLNGLITFDWWLPSPKLEFPGVAELLKKYQARAPKVGVDPLGYYLGPWAYADLQVLGEAVEATKGLDQDKIATYIHATTFKTVVGDVKFGEDGEWAVPRMLQVQYQHIKSNDVEQFRDPKNSVILTPPNLKDGTIVYPYADALK
jgi:branched-chain amino acid transport system substrate-binding protein